MDKIKEWSKKYTGFEHILDFWDDFEEVLELITPDGEWLGTIEIKITYIPE